MYNRGDAIVVNCTFSGNSGELYTHSNGGGIADYYGDSLTVVNCIFSGNSTGFGGGMFNRRSSSTNVVNCTFSSNSATLDGDGGGIYNRDCNPVITNCIIWGNIGEQIYNYYSTADPKVTYSCVQGSYPGVGNISSNPLFSGSNLYLQNGSPCIDAGSNDSLPPDTLDLDDDIDTTELIPWDRASKLRRADDPAVDPDTGNAGVVGPPIVDMGAYEVSPIFVDDNALFEGDGRSWATAFKYLQDALYAAADPLSGRGEIRVAQGTYYPDQDEGGHVTPSDRAATFEMQNNLAIRGGYRGPTGGDSPDDRNITAFETILSGDYAGSDDPNDPNSYNENSYHVASSNDTDATAILEGFTVTGGNANGPGGSSIPRPWHDRGGGIYNWAGSPTLTDLVICENTAERSGGGIYIRRGEPIILRCSFSMNHGASGGGIYCDFSYLTLVDCAFLGNSARLWSGGGVSAGTGATLRGCSFIENSATNGGGMEIGFLSGSNDNVVLENCTFKGNSARAYNGNGGAIHIDGDTDSLLPEMRLILANCTFSGNSAYRGGAIYTITSSWDGWCNMTGTLSNCTLGMNTANEGGGIYWLASGLLSEGILQVSNCILWGNCDSNGVDESSQIHVLGSVETSIAHSCIQNCSTYCSDPNDQNIGTDPNDNPQFVRDPNGGDNGWGDDPCTPDVDESLNDDYGDLRLTAGSPCIDMGNNETDIDASTPEIVPLPDTDLDGRPRFADGDCNDTNTVDMGAYEFTYAYIGDFDVDCDVDFADYAIFADYWLTDELLVDIAPTPAGDGIIDQRDLNILCDNWLFGK
jgi:predicted outer membrane repeat protein